MRQPSKPHPLSPPVGVEPDQRHYTQPKLITRSWRAGGFRAGSAA